MTTSASPSKKRPLRLLFLGMNGRFSQPPLLALLANAAVEVVGIVIAQHPLAPDQPAIERLQPAPPLSTLPLLTPHVSQTIATIGWHHDIPVFALRRPKHPSVLPMLAALTPDVAAVACFSHRIPPTLLALPRYGFLNLHPSLLPAWRGPEPLFWVFRHDGAGAGVTVHLMDEGLDSGDIARQTAVSFPDGIAGPAAEQLCAELGGKLLVEVLEQLQAGTIKRQKQGKNGRYAPHPTPQDFHIPTSWSAQRAFNFIRGTTHWNQPYQIEGLAKPVWGKTAVGYQPHGQLPQPIQHTPTQTHIQFSPGILTVKRKT